VGQVSLYELQAAVQSVFNLFCSLKGLLAEGHLHVIWAGLSLFFNENAILARRPGDLADSLLVGQYLDSAEVLVDGHELSLDLFIQLV